MYKCLRARHLRGRLLTSLAVTSCMAIGAVGGGSADAHSAARGAAAAAKAPPAIKKAGQITICSDIAYPAAESYKNGTPVGFDVDIAKAIGRLWGVRASFQNTGFDGIIAALQSDKCDVLMSAMTITPQRLKQIAFVPYLKTGQAILVKRGSGIRVTSLASLSGKSVGVTVGTTEWSELQVVNKSLAKAGKPTVNAVTFQTDPLIAEALAQGKVDAYFADTTPITYFAKHQSQLFTQVGPLFYPGRFGIGVRKNEPQLRTALQAAINKLYADGQMRSILARWAAPFLALKG